MSKMKYWQMELVLEEVGGEGRFWTSQRTLRSALQWKVKTEVHTGMCLAWKCAIVVFNWSWHIWVLESLQSLCICLFQLLFVSDKWILNLECPSALSSGMDLSMYLVPSCLCSCHAITLCRSSFLFEEVLRCSEQQAERCSLVHLGFLLF